MKTDRTTRFFILIAGTLIIIYGVAGHVRNRVWQSKLSLWTDVVRKAPRNPRGYVNRGHAWLERGKSDRARADFRKALELHPDAYMAHMGLGLLAMARENDFTAARHFRRAVDAKPRYPEAHVRLGLLHENVFNRPQAALDAYQTALRHDTDNEFALLALGRFHLKREQWREAIRRFSTLIDSPAYGAEASLGRGIALLHAGTVDAAVRDLQHALEKSHRPGLAHYYLAAASLVRGNTGAARTHISAARKHGQNVSSLEHRLQGENTAPPQTDASPDAFVSPP